MATQQELEFFQARHGEADWLIEFLKGKDWLTADQILKESGLPATESAKRRLRMLAEGSEGRIAGGQAGYKLVEAMTREEFGHFRNWMLRQSEKMQRRIVLADKIFYSRQAVN